MDNQQILTDTLAALPGIRVLSTADERTILGRVFDLILHVSVRGRTTRLLIETRTVSSPRDIRATIWQLNDWRRTARDEGEFLLVIAPTISERSRQMLREHEIGYCDASGSLYLPFPWAFYLVDRQALRRPARQRRNIYTGSAAQVLHALLLDHKRSWHITELAERAHVSASTAHQVCIELEELLWLDKVGRGPSAIRQLRQPGALLDAWAAEHRLKTYTPHYFHRWSQSSTETSERLGKACAELDIAYALTLTSGARLIATYASDPGQLWALIPSIAAERLSELASLAGLRRVTEGENVTLFATRGRSPLLFRQHRKERWVASDVQLYLDLYAWPQRGKEQAQHLRTERLEY